MELVGFITIGTMAIMMVVLLVDMAKGK